MFPERNCKALVYASVPQMILDACFQIVGSDTCLCGLCSIYAELTIVLWVGERFVDLLCKKHITEKLSGSVTIYRAPKSQV